MIHAFALEPKLVATWGRRDAFRFFHDKFGLGTPRVLLELPAFSKWKRDVFRAFNDLDLSEEDKKRIEELFRIFGEHKFRRHDSREYDPLIHWIENAEREYNRKPFAAIIATENPRAHSAVLIGDHLGPNTPRWNCPNGTTTSRSPEALAASLSPMLINCRELHLVDPHFNPNQDRYYKVLVALTDIIARHRVSPDIIRVHCSDNLGLSFFELGATNMASRLPAGIPVEFLRWRERSGGEKLHNRYVLTDLGGVSFGVGIDAGDPGETDDLLLLPRAQYEQRWSQYAEDNGAFERVDTPSTVRGTQVR